MQQPNRPATMRDVARAAGVSQATVSYVLNNVERYSISEPTRQAVVAAAKELNYHPNRSARSLVSGVSSIVVCIVPPVQLGEPSLELLGNLTLEFAQRDVVLAVHFEQSGDASLEFMKETLRPMEVFSLLSPHGDLRSPGIAPDPGVKLQVTYLVERGHVRIAFASPAVQSLEVQWEWRLRSAQRTAESLGLPPIEERQLLPNGENAGEVVARWVGLGITAVCAHNDEVAFAVLRGIRENGLRCPEDLAVIGYDATILGQTSDPPLTSIAWDSKAIAASLVLQVLDHTRVRTDEIADFYKVSVRGGESA